MRLDDRLRVTPSPALFADLKQLLGPGMPDRMSGSTRASGLASSSALVIARSRWSARVVGRRLGVALDRRRSASSSTTSGSAEDAARAAGRVLRHRVVRRRRPAPSGLLCGHRWRRCSLDRVPLLTLAAVVVGSVARRLADAARRRRARPARPARRSRATAADGTQLPGAARRCRSAARGSRCRPVRWSGLALVFIGLTPRRVADPVDDAPRWVGSAP